MHVDRIVRHRIQTALPYVLFILMAISIVFFQMSHQFFINGTDSFFHMSITYDTYRQIKSGHFSYFLSAFGFYHSLRIVNAVYGPLGGYFSGLLLLIAGNWVRWELAWFLIVFTVAGVSMYQLCRYWNVTRIYSVLLGCLYMFSFPIMSLWQNSQYDGLGAAFMPWVLYFGSIILNHDDFKSWKLVVLLVILAEVHVFSLLLGLLALGLCFVMSLVINRGRGALILKTIKVLLMTALLSFNVWGGIIEVIGSNHGKIIPTYSFTNMFQNVWSSIFYNQRAPLSQNLFLLGFSTTVLIVMTIGMFMLGARHLNLQQDVMMATGLIFLWLSSRLFPWPEFQRRFPILNTDLQFPKRFLPVALSALLLMLGILLTKLQHHVHNHVFVGILLTIGLGMFVIHAWQNTQYQGQYLYHQQVTASYYGNPFHHATGDGWLNNRKRPWRLVASYRCDDPGRYFRLVTKTTPDYMPSNQKIRSDAQYHHLNAYNQYYQQIVQNRLPYRAKLSHHVMTISFDRNSTRSVTLPFVKYAHTRVTMNGRSLHNYERSSIGAITFKPRAGRNVMRFKYEPSAWYRVGTWLSILVWITFLIRMGLVVVDHHKF